jgi:DnaJ-class molecular chaperone
MMISDELKNDFISLGIDEGQIETATIRDVIVAFRKLAMKIHPDKVYGDEADKDKASEAFKGLSNSYQRTLKYLIDNVKGHSAKQMYGRRGQSTQYRQERAPDVDRYVNTNLDYQYSVPTYSRFSNLGDFFPGNY